MSAPRLWLLVACTALLFLSLQALLSIDLHTRSILGHAGPSATRLSSKVRNNLEESLKDIRHNVPTDDDDDEYDNNRRAEGVSSRENTNDKNDLIAHGKEMSLALRQKLHSGSVETAGAGDLPLLPAGAGVVNMHRAAGVDTMAGQRSALQDAQASAASLPGDEDAAPSMNDGKKKSRSKAKVKLPAIPPLTLTDELRKTLGWTLQPVPPLNTAFGRGLVCRHWLCHFCECIRE
jgi:hypothetical protein